MSSKLLPDRQNKIESQFAEPLSETSINVQPVGLAVIAKRIWQVLSNHFLSRNELQVRQRRDRFGNVWWAVYDPQSGRSVNCSTEQEVRIWLEQRRFDRT